MLLMNLTEEENLNRVSLLIDTGFVRFLYIAMFEQVQRKEVFACTNLRARKSIKTP